MKRIDIKKEQRWQLLDWVVLGNTLFAAFLAAMEKNYFALCWIILAAVYLTLGVGWRIEMWKAREKHLDAMDEHLASLRKLMRGVSKE